MKQRSYLALALAAGAALLVWGGLTAPPARSQELSHVVVTNFPDPQRIAGAVTLDEPIRQSKMIAIRDVVVPPVPASQTTRWVDAGLLSTDGFPSVVLSLHGEVRGDVAHRGGVVAVLIPDETSIGEAFQQRGLAHFAMEVVAPDVHGGQAWFASTQPRYTVGFPRYRVWFYNETDKAITAHLFAYLTN